ncbi:lytic polysaccharide monooxygenase auxiliary activity family 9 protein [Allosalinactinospora lopnorensis]|uniref:lytic polysaccharide monooxygenase auxiliary activity family 9 protein n=1 Tax=Allosalinactinospora lopnorensis TaxID=1352348 RepID=UPI000697BC1C|nr:lytic polysaccharide monooxygenase auxiliary activity family 9 protein [Allosalinactinospora lopnorensis]
MRKRRTVTTLAAVGGFTMLFSVFAAGSAHAHGTMADPASRVYQCLQEGPESPQSAACQDAIAEGGTQPIYDWNEINIPNADGRHREIIPDGRLCSAGRDKYAAFDAPRDDWPSTGLPSGGTATLTFHASAPHVGTYYFYLTNDGYDPTEPLNWSDLESEPLAEVTDPESDGQGMWSTTVDLPERSGKHLLYVIWQRSDSPEAFYSCSDVDF